jgi:hypothetical protein
MPFFNFIFNSFQERINLPAIQGKPNKYYLPDVLGGIDSPDTPGKKLLPLVSSSWSIGAITGASGNTISGPIATWYSTYLVATEHLPTASTVGLVDPSRKDPVLDLSNVCVNSLNNIFVMPAPVVQDNTDSYIATITLCFNKVQALPNLNITGDFLMAQAVCLSDNKKPPACNGHFMNVEGTGKFALDFNSEDTFLDAKISISVSGQGSARKLDLRILNLNFRGKSNPLPKFSVKVLSITNAPKGIEKTWVTLANQAFDSPDAKANLIANLNQTLNEQKNRDSISGTLLGQLNNGLDNIFGPVPSTGLPDDTRQQVGNAADLYILARVKASLNNPTSNYYLPMLLMKNSSPQLEPYPVSSIDLGDQNIKGLPWGPNTFSSIVIRGLSNNIALPENVLLKDPDLTITTIQGRLTAPPAGIPSPPLVIAGNFSLTPKGMRAITGNFNVNVAESNLKIVCTASGDRVEMLAVRFSQLQLLVDTTQINIQLNFPGDSGPLASLANQVVQTSSVKSGIVSKINDTLSSSATLQSFSNQITQGLKDMIIAQMGGSIQ